MVSDVSLPSPVNGGDQDSGQSCPERDTRCRADGARRISPPPSFVHFAREEIERTIPDRFESQVVRHGGRLAVKLRGQALDYEELNALANRIAHAILAKRGDGPEPIATLTRPTPLGTAAALGILKAGKCWLPLDPSHPKARLSCMLDDSETALILTDSRAVAVAGELSSEQHSVIDLDELPDGLPEESPAVAASADSFAYIIYSSGSTGKPKGVLQNHRNVLHSTFLHTNTCCIAPDDRLSLLTTYSHLTGVTAIFRSLLNGAALFPYHILEDGIAQLADWLVENGITIYTSVPTVFRHFVASLDEPRDFSDLRLIHLGGETVSRHDVALYKRHFAAHCLLLNNLGSTEVSIFRQFVVDKETEIESAVVPVGYEIEDKEVLLLDEQGDEVSAGESGEIVIRSPFVALEYWREPELTRQSFLRDPANGRQRLFRTGDLGRLLPDGALVLVGRKDHQVKIRGQRVELSEIEARLVEHPGVRECAVLGRNWRSDDKRLIAYVVPAAGEEPPPGETLREHLRLSLPPYMIPALFVTLPALPLTLTGKIDRQALPEPALSGEAREYVAPRGELEARLAELWGEVLGVERVGIEDNFFELGGHSLKAIQLATRVRERLALELPLAALFEAPTVAALAGRLEDERSEPLEPLESLESLEPTGRGPRPLSFSQRLWFLDLLEPRSAAYHITSCQRLSGPLDLAALERALEAILWRHQSLRTRFSSSAGEPLQSVAECESMSLPLIELESEAELPSALSAEARRPFDLSAGPLLRARLFRLGPREHVLLLVLHHIAADAWSVGVLFRELGALYGSFCRGEEPGLPPLPIQYADFAAWQAGRLRGPLLSEQLDYWRRQLAGAPAALDLPADHPRPALQRHRGGRSELTLPRPLLQSVEALCRGEQVTLFSTLLAAFKTLLFRYSGQSDLVVGSPVAGRLRRELEGLIGCFVNTLVLRTSLAGSPTFRTLLARVHRVVLEALAHQELPFERLIEELRPERDLGRTPLFQVLFVLQNARENELELEGLERCAIAVDRGAAPFDLSLYLSRSPEGGLRVIAEYDRDLFEAPRIERLLDHYRRLLRSAVDHPGRGLGELEMLSDEERTEILRQSRGPDVPLPPHCVHTLFEAQARRVPARLAALDATEELSYRELDQRSNQLAHRLAALGVGPGVLVGISMERSVRMLTALLGVLKAGGAYVPLDPTYPSRRLELMVSDSGLGVLLVEERHLGLFESIDGSVELLCTERESERLARLPTEPPESAVRPEDLAYVIYTSGSTGTPKGVEIPHRAVVNFLASMAREPGLSETDTLLSVTTLAFDISVLELLLPLCRGARCVVTSGEVASDARLLSEAIAEHAPTLLQATPATWRALRDAGWTGAPGLKILCGGEALGRQLAEQLLACGASLWNLYGPTETTVWSALKRVERGSRGEVPIGSPIENTQLYVLDPDRQLLPNGIPGELYIGGEGLARGYRDQPELTAARFCADPFSGREGARLYRTGDLVRRGRNGELEFLGRLDHQVKVRGFRIELGEIEVRLGEHAAVAHCVVLARRDTHGDHHLVAYLLPRGQERPAAAALREHLQRSLPHYMLPAHFLWLDEFPLTPNGKIDRRALPEPGSSGEALEYVAPRDELEERLAALWCEVLGLERVGVHDSFFELGGHSLRAARLFSRIQGRFGVYLPLATLFQAPTITHIAEEIRRCERRASRTPLVAIQPAGSRPPLVLVHAAAGNVLLYRELAAHLGNDQPVYGLQAMGANGEGSPLTGFEDMASHYVSELKSFRPSGPYFLGGYCLGGTLAYEMARQLRSRGDDVRLVLLFETYNIRHGKRRGRSPWLRRTVHLAQNLKFHVQNVLSVTHRERLLFLRNKIRVATNRALGHLNLQLSRILDHGRLKNDENSRYLQLTRVNDAHHRNYDPRSYAGDVVLFRPSVFFRDFDDPDFGWRQLIGESLEVHELSVAPRGMLVEPHVRALASRVRLRMDRALESEPPSSDWQGNEGSSGDVAEARGTSSGYSS